MVTAGVDVGAATVKAVILKDGQIVGRSVFKVELEREEACEEAFDKALTDAAIDRSDVEHIIATGTGRDEVSFANDTITDIIAGARGAAWLFPGIRTVIDVGAEEARGIKADRSGKVISYAKNEKCAAGVGAFADAMARALEIGLDEMGPLSLKSTEDIAMNAACVVFAESEVVSLIHARKSKENIAKAVHEAIATRITSMLRRVGIEKEVAIIGGMAKNIGVIECLNKHLGVELRVPEDPRIMCAVGAALIAETGGE